jgi:hypothetical protein
LDRHNDDDDNNNSNNNNIITSGAVAFQATPNIARPKGKSNWQEALW